MKGTLTTGEDRLRVYLIVPVVVLQVASTLAYGTYFALVAVRPEVGARPPTVTPSVRLLLASAF